MNIQLLSDLHLETHPHWRATPAPGADVLVLAGDIGSYQTGHRMADEDFGLRQFSPLAGWPTPVIFVPGNHEYDTLDFDLAHERLRVPQGVARDELGAAVEGRQIEAHAGSDSVEPEGVGGAHRSLLMEATPRRGAGRQGAAPPVAPKRGRAVQRIDRTVDR